MSILNDRQTDVIPEGAAIPRHACVLTTVRIIVLTLLFGAPLGFGEGTGGLVREVNGEIVTVAFAGPMPHVGDDVEFFFEMEGLDAEISVASGKVIAVDESGLLKVKIEKATGTVEKEQLVRFSSNTADASVLPNKPSPPERHTLTPAPSPMPSATPTVSAPAASPASTSSPSGTAAMTNPSIVGNWVGTYRNGTKYSFTFKADQTVTWTIDEKSASSDARIQTTVRAEYRVDSTAKPNRMDLFDFDSLVPKGETLHWPFELQGDSQFKMDLSQGAAEHPEKGFTEMATIFSRVP